VTGYQPSGLAAPVMETVVPNGSTSTRDPVGEGVPRRFKPSGEVTVAVDAEGVCAATDATATPDASSRIKAAGTRRSRAFS
jgi:hypothetical protein